MDPQESHHQQDRDDKVDIPGDSEEDLLPSNTSDSDDSAVDDEDRQIRARWNKRKKSKMSVHKHSDDHGSKRVFSVDDSMLDVSGMQKSIDTQDVSTNRSTHNRVPPTKNKTSQKQPTIDIFIGCQSSNGADSKLQNLSITSSKGHSTPLKTYSFKQTPKKPTLSAEKNPTNRLTKSRRRVLEETINTSKDDLAHSRRSVKRVKMMPHPLDPVRRERSDPTAQHRPGPECDQQKMNISLVLWQGEEGNLGRKRRDLQDLDIVLDTLQSTTLEYRNSLEKGPLRKAVNMFGRELQADLERQIEMRHKTNILQANYKKSQAVMSKKRRQLLDLQRQANRQREELSDVRKRKQECEDQQKVKVIHGFLHSLEDLVRKTFTKVNPTRPIETGDVIFMDNHDLLFKEKNLSPSSQKRASDNISQLKYLLREW